MKWLPFKSLPEQEDYLKDMERKRNQVKPPELSEDEKEQLDYTLNHLEVGQRIKVIVFENGNEHKYDGDFEGVLIQRHLLLLSGMAIALKKIIGIENESDYIEYA